MKKHLEGALLALFMLVASQAAAQRLSFTEFTGPGGPAVRNQLVSQVCDTADCVAATKVTTGGKPDLKKGKKESLQFFITGTVKKGKVDLAVLAVGKTLAPKAKRAFNLEGGALSARSLQAAVELLRGAIGQPSESTTPEVRQPTPQPAPQPVAQPEPERQPVATRQTEPVDPEPAPPPPPVKRSKKKPTFLAIELGSDVLNRSLGYVQATTTNLRKYDLPVFPLPTARLEFYPLALAGDGILSGLGVEGGFGFAPFLKSRRQSSTDSFPTTAMRVDAGLRWRIVPVKTFALAIIPYAGLRLQSFTVGASSTGMRLDGLPNISFTGLRAGLGLEVPIIEDRLLVFGRFGVIPVFSSGEIISAAYFPSGSTFGLEAGGGVGIGLLPMLQIRLSFEYTQYGMTFKTQATDTYIAAGATDRYLGGNAAVRLQF